MWLHNQQWPIWWTAWLLSGMCVIIWFLLATKCNRIMMVGCQWLLIIVFSSDHNFFFLIINHFYFKLRWQHFPSFNFSKCQGATLSALLLGYQAQVTTPSENSVFHDFSFSWKIQYLRYRSNDLIWQGKVLKDHPPMKLLVSISGSKFRDPSICEVAYKDPIKVRSVHFIGAKDWLRVPSEELATAFDNPLILRHPQGHTVPRLGGWPTHHPSSI